MLEGKGRPLREHFRINLQLMSIFTRILSAKIVVGAYKIGSVNRLGNTWTTTYFCRVYEKATSFSSQNLSIFPKEKYVL